MVNALWAVGREGGREGRRVAFLTSNAAVSGRKEDRHASSTQLGVSFAQFAVEHIRRTLRNLKDGRAYSVRAKDMLVSA